MITELRIFFQAGSPKHSVLHLNDQTNHQHLHFLPKVKYFQLVFLKSADSTEKFQLLKNLPNKYNSGLYKIRYISDPLADVVDECLSTGQFPTKLEEAKQMPIYKNSDQPGRLKLSTSFLFFLCSFKLLLFLNVF